MNKKLIDGLSQYIIKNCNGLTWSYKALIDLHQIATNNNTSGVVISYLVQFNYESDLEDINSIKLALTNNLNEVL